MSVIDRGTAPMQVEVEKTMRFNIVNVGAFIIAVLITGAGWGTVSATVTYEMSNVRQQMEKIQNEQKVAKDKYDSSLEVVREQQGNIRALIDRISRTETNTENINKRVDRVVEQFNSNLEKTNNLLIETSKNTAVLTNELRVRKDQQP